MCCGVYRQFSNRFAEMDHKWSDRLDPSESEEEDREGIGCRQREIWGEWEMGDARKWLLSDAKTEEPFQGDDD